jgi:zinc and cadmium transporter
MLLMCYYVFMSPAFMAILAVLVVSVVSLVGVITLRLRDAVLRPLIVVLVGLSVGALFGDAFIHLLPEAFETAPTPLSASIAVSAGVLVFFILEKFLRWRHSHGLDEESADTESTHTHDAKHIGWIVFAGDGLHNFIDGIIIGASFLVSPHLGIATTIAIVLHEIPQEIGDFGLLLHAGWSRAGALAFNFLSALFAVLGTIIALLLGGGSEATLALLNAFAAGGFVYIAGADLVPELQGGIFSVRKSIVQTVAVALGFIVMFALTLLE